MTVDVTAATNVSLVWDLGLERPTLGGALVLRAEGELLGGDEPANAMSVRVFAAPRDEPRIAHFAQHVFATSARKFRLSSLITSPAAAEWPSPTERTQPGFSYFSFSRLITLHRETGQTPRLVWNHKVRTDASACRERFKGRLICVHLRCTPPYTAEESNAEASAWNDFFNRHASDAEMNFLLLGDDPLPSGFKCRPGVIRAVDLRLPLGVQLALVDQADAFLGMASGICAAANFSETPHVIFKHPSHHAEAMRTELGDADHFPFASPRQHIWRRVVDAPILDSALTLVLS